MKTHNMIEKLLVIENKKERLKKELKEEWERKSPEFQQFLAEQVFLPPEKWDEKFNNYVRKKHKLEQEMIRYIPQWSIEEEKERQFKRYLKSLDVAEKDLKNKKILDLGCGVEGNFIKICLEKGITADIYGLNGVINPIKVAEKYKKNLFGGNFTKEIPGENYDYIFAVGSAGSHDFGEERVEAIKKTISLAIKSLKGNGELRIAPIFDSLQVKEKNIPFAKDDWEDCINSLAEDEKMEYQFRPIDIRFTAGKFENVVLDEVLIIKKKPK